MYTLFTNRTFCLCASFCLSVSVSVFLPRVPLSSNFPTYPKSGNLQTLVAFHWWLIQRVETYIPWLLFTCEWTFTRINSDVYFNATWQINFLLYWHPQQIERYMYISYLMFLNCNFVFLLSVFPAVFRCVYMHGSSWHVHVWLHDCLHFG